MSLAPTVVPHARKTDPETSHAAATSLGDLRASQREVLQLFHRFGALDDRSLIACAAHAGVRQSDSGLRTRRAELVRLGLVYDTGRRVVPGGRPPHRPRIVWAMSPAGL